MHKVNGTTGTGHKVLSIMPCKDGVRVEVALSRAQERWVTIVDPTADIAELLQSIARLETGVTDAAREHGQILRRDENGSTYVVARWDSDCPLIDVVFSVPVAEDVFEELTEGDLYGLKFERAQLDD